MAQSTSEPGALPDYEVIQMISAKSIAARIESLAREIEAAFAGTDKLVVVGLLRGSFVFIADLVREIHLPIEVDFLEASSYGNAMASSREVRILKDLRGEIAGRDVLDVEDKSRRHGQRLNQWCGACPEKSREPARAENRPRAARTRVCGARSHHRRLDRFSRSRMKSSSPTASTNAQRQPQPALIGEGAHMNGRGCRLMAPYCSRMML